MAVERGDSTAPVGGTYSDAPTTFEQTTLKGTTTTGNAKLVKRDATEIDVIDTNGYWSATTVEGVLDEIATLTGLDSAIQDQIDALDVRLTTAEGDIAAEETARINEDLTFLKLDGSRTMSGAINTSHGGLASTKASSATVAPFEFTSNSDIYNNTTYQWLSYTDSGGKEFRITTTAHPTFGGKCLTYETVGWSGFFDGQIFKAGGILGQTLFTNEDASVYLGFNPGANAIVTSSTTYIAISGNYGGTAFATLSDTYWIPGTTGTADLGVTGNRFKNGWFTGQVQTSSAAPTDAAHLTRKDYVDSGDAATAAAAEDNAIAYAIALGG